MALQPCRECGARVSTEAETCPHCGVPDPTAPTGALAPETRIARGGYAAPQNMTSQEEPVYRAHVHWIIYGRAALAAAAAGIALPFYKPGAIGFAALAVILGIIAYISGSSTEFVITTRRLIAKRGIISRHTIETLLEKVEAVSVEQSLMGRILNYGSITVQGTGGTREQFARVSHPMELRRIIHEQIDGTTATAGERVAR